MCLWVHIPFFIRRYFNAASQAAHEVLGRTEENDTHEIEDIESSKADLPEQIVTINLAYGSSSFRDSFKRKLEATGGIDYNDARKTASGEGTTKRHHNSEDNGHKVKEVSRQYSISPPLKPSYSMTCHFANGVKATTTLVSPTPPHNLAYIALHWGPVLTPTFLFTASSCVHGETRTKLHEIKENIRPKSFSKYCKQPFREDQ